MPNDELLRIQKKSNANTYTRNKIDEFSIFLFNYLQKKTMIYHTSNVDAHITLSSANGKFGTQIHTSLIAALHHSCAINHFPEIRIDLSQKNLTHDLPHLRL